MATLYVMAGIMHFVKPKVYLRIMPPYLPNPKLLNKIAGLAEIILGLGLLHESTRSLAAWGIILLLVAVFPANLYMYQKKSKGIPEWALLIRLPLQLVLIFWAYLYT
ncbi:DoxX family protein [Pararhodonellum marinum]|uniref:DoxX family protein n=1 Tax=Pararhodonellum marinum TaxID=2755358 RepID=UPI00293BFEC1|nr:DoxX family protein [Pararhodonellum marinum]